MVTLGAFTPTGGTDNQRIGAFMHELGHTLGLGHGGGDDVHWKPNYYSVMNFLWQFPGDWQGNTWEPRYSEEQLPTLDETALDESTGLQASNSGKGVLFRHTGATLCAWTKCGLLPGACTGMAPMDPGAPVDWDGDCNNMTPGSVAVDINDFHELAPSPALFSAFGQGTTSLEGHDDWANLRYSFRMSPHYPPGAPAGNIDCTFDTTIAAFLDSIPALTTAYCTAKMNSCGNTPAIASIGHSSAAATSGFIIQTTGAREGKSGLPIYSSGGRANLPFSGGVLCVAQQGLRRGLAVPATGGSVPAACDAILSVDWIAFATGALGGSPASFLLVPGQTVNVQWWGRDSVPNGALLSDGLEYIVAP